MSKSYAIGIDIDDKEYKYVIENIKLSVSFDVLSVSFDKLKTLNVYDNENKLESLYCSYNYLTELKIIGGKNITYISCEDNKLTSLDLSMCKKLERLCCDFELEQNLILPDNHKLNNIYFY